MWAMSEPSGPMEKGTTYMVRPFMQPVKRPLSCWRISAGVTPVVGGAGVDLLLGADEGAVLDPGHVGGVGVGPVAVGPLGVGQLGERAGVDQFLAEAVVLVGRTVAPLDAVRGGQRGHLVDPGQEFACFWRIRGHRSCVGLHRPAVRPVSVGSNARHVPWVPPNLGARCHSRVKTKLCSLFGGASETELRLFGLRDDAGVSRRPGGGPWWSRSTASWRACTSTSRFVQPSDVGWKALMRALSDLAAMGARPSGR